MVRILTADDLIPVPAVPVLVTRTTDSSPLVSQTGVQADTQLVVPVGANQVYYFDVRLRFNAANTAMDTKIGWTVPAGTTMEWGALGLPANTTGGFGGATSGVTPSVFNETQNTNWGSAAGDYLIGIAAFVYTSSTAGNVTLAWAQLTSDPGALTLKAYSFIEATRIV